MATKKETHGTEQCYQRSHCRCASCTNAARTTRRERRLRRKVADPDGLRAEEARRRKSRKKPNREKTREYHRQWRQNHKDIYRQTAARWRRRNRDKALNTLRLCRAKKTGLLEDQFIKPQTPNCEICGVLVKTVFDHCHRTGLFRGWLCRQCNLALGFAKDSPIVLQAMIKYLQAYP